MTFERMQAAVGLLKQWQRVATLIVRLRRYLANFQLATPRIATFVHRCGQLQFRYAAQSSSAGDNE